MALCLVSAFGFGCMAIFAKDAYKQDLGITALLALRFGLAALIFWAIARLRGPIVLPPRRVLLAGLGLGAFGYAAQSGLFFGAVKRMDASTTSLLLYTYPAIVFIAALALRRERADRRRLAALALAIAGIVLVSTILPVSAFLAGLRRVGASTASILSCFEPVVTVSLAMVLYGERLGPGQLAGGALVLAAVILLQAKVRGDDAPAIAPGPAPARAIARELA